MEVGGGGDGSNSVMPMEANRGARTRVHAARKALEGDDRQTDYPSITVTFQKFGCQKFAFRNVH